VESKAVTTAISRLAFEADQGIAGPTLNGVTIEEVDSRIVLVPGSAILVGRIPGLVGEVNSPLINSEIAVDVNELDG